MARIRPALLAPFLMALLPPPAHGQSILTVAGGGTDDGRPATAAGLGNASGVTVDVAGSILIADTNNNRIRRVDSVTGIITTFAGNGSTGYAGDGGPATQAGLHEPSRVALDVRTGIITTLAGTGSADDSGDGGPAADAGLPYPTGLAVDGSGNIFVAEYYDGRVRRIDAAVFFRSAIKRGELFDEVTLVLVVELEMAFFAATVVGAGERKEIGADHEIVADDERLIRGGQGGNVTHDISGLGGG